MVVAIAGPLGRGKGPQNHAIVEVYGPLPNTCGSAAAPGWLVAKVSYLTCAARNSSTRKLQATYMDPKILCRRLGKALRPLKLVPLGNGQTDREQRE